MITDLSPTQVQALLADRAILLVDVREPPEYAASRIHGALLFPLSSFDPACLPSPDKVRVVFQCGSGKRSAMAVARCRQAGIGHGEHLAGGIQAWMAAGLPIVALDPASGAVLDRR